MPNLKLVIILSILVNLIGCKATPEELIKDLSYEEKRDIESNYKRTYSTAIKYPSLKAKKLIDFERDIPIKVRIRDELLYKSYKEEILRLTSGINAIKSKLSSDNYFINEFYNEKKYVEFSSSICHEITQEYSHKLVSKSNFETDEEYKARKISVFNEEYKKFISPIYFFDSPPAKVDYNLKNNEWDIVIRKGPSYRPFGTEEKNSKIFVIEGESTTSKYNGKSLFGLEKEVLKLRESKCLIDSDSLLTNNIKFTMPLKKARNMVEPTQRIFFKITPIKHEYYTNYFYLPKSDVTEPTIDLAFDKYIEWALLEV
jgi:hypothetical protein